MPGFLSPDHWTRIADAVFKDTGGRGEDADFAWLAGVASLEQAMAALAANGRPSQLLAIGELSLERALLEDPSMADSWLALFLLESLKPTSSYDRYAAIAQALAVCADRLGEQQQLFRRHLAAYYVPLMNTRVAISTPTDARLIYVGHLTAHREHAAAAGWLERCDHSLSQAIAAHAYLKLHRGDYAGAGDLFELLAEDPRFGPEGHLGAGVALAGLGLWESAVSEMTTALELSPTIHLQLEARYLLASVLAHLDRDLERRELEQIFAVDPGFADVADRLGRAPVPPASFDDIVALFRSGAVADSPEIEDNA